MTFITFGIPFNCPADIAPHLQMVFSGEYEIPLNPWRPRILDLGANCGAFALWAAHRWPGCHIDAYEPHPDNFLFLKENCAAYPNIILHNYAVGNPGFRPLFDGLCNGGEASLHHMQHNPAPLGRHVEVKSPLELPEADILKADTEGCELEILRPLIESGREFKAILLEYHDEGHRREIDQLLSDYHLVGSAVAHPIGRGTVRYLHKKEMKK